MHESWPYQLAEKLNRQPCVLVTVVSVRGSAPRAPGSRMIISADSQYGSIGGGNLEFEAMAIARDLLAGTEAESHRKLEFGLGPALNQCCGGSVVLLFESLPGPGLPWLDDLLACLSAQTEGMLVTRVNDKKGAKWVLRKDRPEEHPVPDAIYSHIEASTVDSHSQPVLLESGDDSYLLETLGPQKLPLALFGAGHVAKAVIEALACLPFQVTWVDSRPGLFPDSVPESTRIVISSDPAAEVRNCPPRCLYLVMTHSHEMDEDICFEVLERGDMSWLGLIGSVTKRRRFAHRLAKRGISDEALQHLECPVGLAGISGKRPATIAVSIAAQLLSEQVPDTWR